MRRFTIARGSVAVGLGLLCVYIFCCTSYINTAPPVREAQAVLASEVEVDPQDVGQIDKPPELTYFAAPEYPQLAKQAGLEGRVWIRVFVNSSGAPLSAEVYVPSETAALDEAAVSAAKRCRYIPAQLLGANVPVRVIYAVDFMLPKI